MDETLENTLLCGVKLSRSMTWGDFQDVLTLGASHEEVYSAMGNDYETDVNDSQIKYSENGVMRYLFGFRDLSDTDELAYILIYFNE